MTSKEKTPFDSWYEHFLDDAYMAIDLLRFWACVEPTILCRSTFTCTDGTKVWAYLVCDDGQYFIWIGFGDSYFEFYLCPIPESLDSIEWSFSMNDQDVKNRTLSILEEVKEGGVSYLQEKMKNEGILTKRSLAITDKRIDSFIKLPISCAISVYGQVLHGVKGLEEYCRMQVEDSSPYILKKIHIHKQADYDSDKTLFCRNYLICKTKSEAEAWMPTFIGIGDVSALEPDEIDVPDNFPPLLSYVDACRHMVLTYLIDEYDRIQPCE